MEEAVGSLCFAHSDPLKSNSETGSISSVVNQERMNDISIEEINDIERVDR
jgi:hypothetical protein